MGAQPPADKPRKRKGFSAGPANLPDGTYKRKVDKIKKSLIHKAKVWKSYAKVIAKEPLDDPNAVRVRRLLDEAAAERQERERQKGTVGEGGGAGADVVGGATRMHPQRQAALDKPEVVQQEGEQEQGASYRRKPKKKKTSSFLREEREAARVKEEREAKRREAELKRKAVEKSQQERMRRKKAMNARTARGQQKLGRQSRLLLEKVQSQLSAS